MNVRRLDLGECIGARRGDVVACIPVFGGHELFERCLESVLAHTSPEITIMILDDASPDQRTWDFVSGLRHRDAERELVYLRRERNIGFPANVNGAFLAAAPADVVVLNSDCVVGHGWLDDLRDAAYDSDHVATATALTNHGSIVSVPELWRPQPVPAGPWDFDAAAASVRARSRRIRPRLPTAVGHCMYVRRTALELVGSFDIAFTPGYGEEVDFSQRCLLMGLCHVLADDVFVLHYGGGSFVAGDERRMIQDTHERVIAARYPYYHDGLRALRRLDGPLSQALHVARRALSGSAVTIDLRGFEQDGLNDADVVSWLRTLVSTPNLTVATVIDDACRPGLARGLSAVDDLAVMTEAQARRHGPVDLVHRWGRVASVDEFAGLRALGERVILTPVDLGAYHNPAYSEGFRDWEAQRAMCRLIARHADGVVFFSDRARSDALAEGLVDTRRGWSVPVGVDQPQAGAMKPPPGFRHDAAGIDVILCLAPSLRHANRVFALRLVEQLQLRHDWDGQLLLVGSEAKSGSSFADERHLLAGSPRLAGATVVLPAVDDAERRWLLSRCGLLLALSVGHGLDLTPFEAAQHGTPTLWAPGTWLDEVLQAPDGAIVPWDASGAADSALALLREPFVRERMLTTVRSALSRLTCTASAEALVEVYESVCAMPAVVAIGPSDESAGTSLGSPTNPTTRIRQRAGRRARRWLEPR